MSRTRPTHGSLLALAAAALIAAALVAICEKPHRGAELDATRPAPARSGAARSQEAAPDDVSFPITITDPGAPRREAPSSRNTETLRGLIGGRTPHDLALLEEAERAGQPAAREAAEDLLRLRDAGVNAATLEAHVTARLAGPPSLHAAARRWLEAELGPAGAEASPAAAGRGPALQRHLPVDASGDGS